MTRRQFEVLEFIRTYIGANGFSPSYEDIRKGLGLRSKSEVARFVDALEVQRRVTRIPGSHRSISLAEAAS